MSTSKTNKVVPAEQDGMPPEVATELLCNAKKLTNRMRKVCNAAREKVYPSVAPIRGDEYQIDRKIDPETKAARRAKQLTFCQLNSHYARAVRNRARLQLEYIRIMADEKLSEAHKHMIGGRLTERALRQEARQDALALEIKRRQSICCRTSE